MPSCTAVTTSVAGPRHSSSMHSLHHHGGMSRPTRPFEHYGGRHRHPSAHSYGMSPAHGFVRSPGVYPGARGPVDTSPHRGSAPSGSVGAHRDYASPSPRQSVSYHQLEHTQSYTPVSWAGQPGAQVPVQDKWLGPPPPPQAYTVQQPTAESVTSSPMYAQYSPQVFDCLLKQIGITICLFVVD